jgi:hypothetical protein
MNKPTGYNSHTDDGQLQELLELEPVPFNVGRVKQRVFERLGDSAGKTAQTPSQPRQRRLSRRFVVALVAAAVIIAGVPSAFALNGWIATMGEGNIGFFDGTGAADKDVNKPTYYMSMQAYLEQANAPVGQTLSFDGGTITLDTLAVDDNFLNAFFTIRYDEPINTEEFYDGLNEPEWFDLFVLAPAFACTVDGENILAYPQSSGGSDHENDAYFIDERTVGVMMHKVIVKELPDVFDLNIALFGGWITVAAVDSTHFDSRLVDGSFYVTVDKSAPSALTRSITPGTYRVAGAQGVREATIERLSLSPFGAVAIVRAQDFDDIGSLMIVDDRGNTASLQFRGGTLRWSTENSAPYYSDQSYVFELVWLDPQTRSVTVTPVIIDKTTRGGERRLVDLSQVGTQIALSELGGLTVVSYEIEQGTVTVKFKPYGYLGGTSAVGGGPGGGTEFVLQDDGDLSLAELSDGSRHSGIKTSWYDRGDGFIVLTTDYYAATDEELAQATIYEYHYQDYLSADESAALTLPLG